MNWKAQKLCLIMGKFSQSINRSYYAIFHATRALLALNKFDTKKHSGVIAYFNQNYIKTGKIEVKYGKILTLAENIRMKVIMMIFILQVNSRQKNNY
jgi:uncharacterized protein (UPF0332 family)